MKKNLTIFTALMLMASVAFSQSAERRIPIGKKPAKRAILNQQRHITQPTSAKTAGDTIATFPWTEGFEGASAIGFTFIDYDNDGFNWTMESEMSAAHNGYGYITSASYDNATYSALTPDNWMVTHKFQLRDNSSYTLTWEESALNANYYREHYGVYAAPADADYDLGSYTLLQDYTLATASPTTRTLDLSAYAGQTIRLAFRHWNCTDQNALAIGNIATTEQENPVGIDETGTVLSAPLSVALIDITGRVLSEVNTPAPGYRFDTSRLPSGTYLVRVVTTEGISVRKLTVVR